MAKRKKKQPKSTWWEIGYTMENGIMCSWLVDCKLAKTALKKSIGKFGFGRVHFLRRPMPSRLKREKEEICP